MSNNKLFYISNSLMLYCGIIGRDVLTERRGGLITDILPVTHPEINSC